MSLISHVPAYKVVHYSGRPRSALLLIHNCRGFILQSNEHACLGQCDVLIRLGGLLIEALPCPFSNLHSKEMTNLVEQCHVQSS